MSGEPHGVVQPDPVHERTDEAAPGPLAPLGNSDFLSFWLVSCAANMSMWMQDVGAAWLMAGMTGDPLLVALLQAAATAPVFLIGLVGGARADIVDRRYYLAFIHAGLAINTLALLAVCVANVLTPGLLLLLTLVNGVGLALRWPVLFVFVPQLIAREQLPAAFALTSISANLARVAGPLAAGVLISLTGVAAVFTLNAVLLAITFVQICRWTPPHRNQTLPAERLFDAMRLALSFAAGSPPLRAILARTFLFFFQTTALLALLPVVSLRLYGEGVATYVVLMAGLGAGAVIAGLNFSRWHARVGTERLVFIGTIVHAIAAATTVAAPSLWIALIAIVVAGLAWIPVSNALIVSTQLILPDWIRARGMALFQTAMMGGVALGAVAWGHAASVWDVRSAVIGASLSGLALLLLIGRPRFSTDEIDLTSAPVPLRAQGTVAFPIEPDEGPVIVMVAYEVDNSRRDEFLDMMRETRHARRRQGATSWQLLRDAEQTNKYVEYFADEDWAGYQRRLVRLTVSDENLRIRREAFQVNERPVVVRRFIRDTIG